MCMRGGREPECCVSMAWWGADSTTLDSGRVYSDLTGCEGCDEWDRLWGGGGVEATNIIVIKLRKEIVGIGFKWIPKLKTNF